MGISGIATLLIMTVLYALMICKYCFYRHNKKKHDIVRRRLSASASFTRGYSQQNSYNSYSMTPYGHDRPSNYNISTFDSGVSD